MSKRKYTIIIPVKLVHIFLCPSKEIWKIMIDFHNYTEYDILNEHMTTILVTPIKHVLISLHSFSTAFWNLLKRSTMYAASRELYHFSNFYLYKHNQFSWVLSLEKNDPSSITYYGTHTIFLFLSPLVVKYRLNSARATPFIALRRCWGKMAKLIKGIGEHTHKPRYTQT